MPYAYVFAFLLGGIRGPANLLTGAAAVYVKVLTPSVTTDPASGVT